MTNKTLIEKIIEVMPEKQTHYFIEGKEYYEGHNDGIDYCIESLPKILEIVKEHYRGEIEKIDWKEKHICAFNDGNQDCECMKKVIEDIKDLLK